MIAEARGEPDARGAVGSASGVVDPSDPAPLGGPHPQGLGIPHPDAVESRLPIEIRARLDHRPVPHPLPGQPVAGAGLADAALGLVEQPVVVRPDREERRRARRLAALPTRTARAKHGVRLRGERHAVVRARHVDSARGRVVEPDFVTHPRDLRGLDALCAGSEHRCRRLGHIGEAPTIGRHEAVHGAHAGVRGQRVQARRSEHRARLVHEHRRLTEVPELLPEHIGRLQTVDLVGREQTEGTRDGVGALGV